MAKIRLATVWLGGCSGCHMSFLDQDERLIDLAKQADLVYSPFVDIKDFPEDVDLCLIEGAVGNEDHLTMLKQVRKNSKIIVSLGDCAVTGNVTALRNYIPNSIEAVLTREFVENSAKQPQIPTEDVPKLLPQARALHELVDVDFFIPGCPPPADLINYVLGELLAGRVPSMVDKFKYG